MARSRWVWVTWKLYQDAQLTYPMRCRRTSVSYLSIWPEMLWRATKVPWTSWHHLCVTWTPRIMKADISFNEHLFHALVQPKIVCYIRKTKVLWVNRRFVSPMLAQYVINTTATQNFWLHEYVLRSFNFSLIIKVPALKVETECGESVWGWVFSHR